MNSHGRVVFATTSGNASHAVLSPADGVLAETVATGAALRAVLADRYDVALVVVDLGLIDLALLDQLQAPGAPRAILLLDKGQAAITLSANVVNYLDSDASAAEIRGAVLAALPRTAAASVGDFADRDAQRLNSLGREVERIARALSDIAQASQVESSSAVDPASIRAIIKRRREREKYFPVELFSDPAWDMLLDLTAARLERRQVSVSSLCIAAAVPTTTALRWIRNLCELSVFERNVDPDDLRRGLISLSDNAAERMMAYLAGRGAPA